MAESLSEDDLQEDIQRLLNEKKKQELREKYGMQDEWARADLSPEFEAQFLTYVEEFERQFEQAEEMPVRQYIGFPSLRPLTDIPPVELEGALDELLNLLASHGIIVEFLYEVEDREAYRFITEDLLDELIEDIRIPGLRTHFIYEEFYPNDRADAEMWAEEFLYALFGHDEEKVFFTLGDEELYDVEGNPINFRYFKALIEDFYAEYSIISHFDMHTVKAQVDGDYATVEVATTWEGLKRSTNTFVTHTGHSEIRLKRNPYGGWNVIQVKIVGWISGNR